MLFVFIFILLVTRIANTDTWWAWYPVILLHIPQKKPSWSFKIRSNYESPFTCLSIIYFPSSPSKQIFRQNSEKYCQLEELFHGSLIWEVKIMVLLLFMLLYIASCKATIPIPISDVRNNNNFYISTKVGFFSKSFYFLGRFSQSYSLLKFCRWNQGGLKYHCHHWSMIN